MDRLAKYAGTDASATQRLLSIGAFDLFKGGIARVVEQQGQMAAADAVEMYVGLMGFAGAVHPDRLQYVNDALAAAHAVLSAKGGLEGDGRAERQLAALLSLPLAKHPLAAVLQLDDYPKVMAMLRPRTQKDIATKVAHAVLGKAGAGGGAAPAVSTEAAAARLFVLLAPLTRDVAGLTADDLDAEEVEEEQGLVARVLHALRDDDDVGTSFGILKLARAELERGGPRRLRHTLPALVFSALRLVRRVAGADKAPAAAAAGSSPPAATAEAVLQWVHECCVLLLDVPEPMTALRVLLAAAHSASEEARLELLAYDFFEKAFVVYEESLPDARQSMTALQCFASTLQRCYVFGEDNRSALVHTALSYCAKFVRRADQCRALCACSHLAWQDAAPATAAASSSGGGSKPPARSSVQVAACLQRALKAAQAAKRQVAATGKTGDASHVTLYIDVLNKYLYFLERDDDVQGAGPGDVQQVLEQAAAEVAAAPEGALDAPAQRYWANTLAFIGRQAAGSSKAASRFGKLKIPK